jgi:hypothetical protein
VRTGPHVRANWLTQPIGLTDEIEYIVNELERHAEVLSELAKSVDVLVRQIRTDRSHPTRAGKEGSSFRLDGEQITVDLLTDVEQMLELGCLPDAEKGHGVGDVGCHPLASGCCFGAGPCHQVGPRKKCLVLPFGRIDGRRTSPRLGLVEDVVVNQGADLNQLDSRRRRHNPGIENLPNVSHSDGESWTEALPTTPHHPEARSCQFWCTDRAGGRESVVHRFEVLYKFGCSQQIER